MRSGPILNLLPPGRVAVRLTVTDTHPWRPAGSRRHDVRIACRHRGGLFLDSLTLSVEASVLAKTVLAGHSVGSPPHASISTYRFGQPGHDLLQAVHVRPRPFCQSDDATLTRPSWQLPESQRARSRLVVPKRATSPGSKQTNLDERQLTHACLRTPGWPQPASDSKLAIQSLRVL